MTTDSCAICTEADMGCTICEGYAGDCLSESDNGFIGYDLTFTAGLSYVELTIDPARFGIVVDLSLEANGYAFLTVDVPMCWPKRLGICSILMRIIRPEYSPELRTPAFWQACT